MQTHYLPVFWQLTIFVFSVVSMYDYFRLPILAITMCYAGALDTFLFYLKHKKSHQGVVPQANGVSVGILPIVLSISLLGRWGRPGESDPHMYGLAIFLVLRQAKRRATRRKRPLGACTSNCKAHLFLTDVITSRFRGHAHHLHSHTDHSSTGTGPSSLRRQQPQ